MPKRKKKSTPIESRSVRQCFQSPAAGDILPPQFTVGTQSDLSKTTCAYSSAASPMTAGAPSHMSVVTGALAHSPVVAGAPSHSPVVTGALAHSPVLAGAPSLLPVVTGAPSHSPVFTGASSHLHMATVAPSHSHMTGGAPSHSHAILYTIADVLYIFLSCDC